MQEFENNQLESREVANEISMREYFVACGNKWIWFVVSFVVCSAVALFYAKSRVQTFSSTAYILIKSSEDSGASSATAMFTDLGFVSNNSSAVENEIYVVKSTQLMDNVVEDLHINNLYFVQKGLRKVNVYKESPIEVITPAELKVTERPKEIVVKPIDGETFEFETDSISWTKAKYGDKFDTEFGTLSVVKTPEFADKYLYENIYVNVNTIHGRAVDFCKILDVKKADRETVVLQMTFEGSNFKMCQDVLNNLIEAYNQDVINDKNHVAHATEAFIMERINAISKDLSGIDSQIEGLKVANNIPDLKTAAGAFVDEGSKYASNVAEAEMQLSLAQYIKDYIVGMKDNDLIPANMGLSDMGVNTLIEAYNKEYLEYEKMAASSGAANPVLVERGKSLSSMRANIVRSVESFCKSLELKVEKARTQERLANRRIASVPIQEKEISDVLRQQKIKEELYLYLLNKREENALQLAITEPNAKIIEHAGGESKPVAPRTLYILIIGAFLGVLIPAGVIYVIFWIRMLDMKVRSRLDIEQVCDIPIVGELPEKDKEQEGEEMVVTETGRDRLSEAFRIVRGNIDYMMKKREDGLGQVLQFTSTIPSEGKSFVAINLAMTYAQFGRKVVAVDLDLRKGNFSKYLGEKKKLGVSAFLSGKIDNIDDIIIKGSVHPNLDTIALGAMPPNPAQLLLSDRFKEFIQYLREHYSYVFLDTVPYGLVADASIINRRVDMTVYVMREGKVDKRYLPELAKMHANDKIKNMCFLLTDIPMDKSNGRYGYGYGYGYGFDYDEEKKKK